MSGAKVRDMPGVDFSVFTHNSNPGTFTSLHRNVIITRKPFWKKLPVTLQ